MSRVPLDFLRCLFLTSSDFCYNSCEFNLHALGFTMDRPYWTTHWNIMLHWRWRTWRQQTPGRILAPWTQTRNLYCRQKQRFLWKVNHASSFTLCFVSKFHGWSMFTAILIYTEKHKCIQHVHTYMYKCGSIACRKLDGILPESNVI